MKLPCTFLFVFLAAFVHAQGTSSVRGQLVDKETRVPLIGAVVQLFNDTAMQGGAVTDVDGNFRIDKVPVGRYTIKAQYTGYLQVLMPNIIVNTGKETILNLELETSAVQVNEVVIKGDRKEG